MAMVAREFAKRGLRVIPLQTPNEKGECSCGVKDCKRSGKHPRWDPNDLPNGVKSATTNISQIIKWWKRWPNANIGIATGGSLTVIDVDGEEGRKSIASLIPGDWEKCTLTSASGNDGLHLYFKNTGEPLPNAVKFASGLDIRDSGGYVVAPPSLHRNGSRYSWKSKNTMVILPESIRKNVREARKPPVGEEDWEKSLHVSERETHLTRLAGKMISQKIPPDEVESLLYAWNLRHCHPPHDERMIKKIVASISKAENSKQPRKEEKKGPNFGDIDPTKPLPTLTHREMLERFGGKEVEWVIEGWLPEAACGLAVAPPETYKTWNLLDLTWSIVKEKLFLGHFPTLKTGPVIVAQQEDAPSMLLERFGSIQNISPPTWSNDSDPIIEYPEFDINLDIRWHVDRQLNFQNWDSILALEELVKQVRPVLVLLDPLYSAISSKDFGAESAQQMLYLKTIRDRYNCSFLLAHHTTKKFGMGGRDRDDMWGSQFLNAWLEFGWQIRPDGKHSVKILRHFKNSPQSRLLKLNYDITQWTYKVGIEDIEDDEEFQIDASANGKGPQGATVRKKFGGE